VEVVQAAQCEVVWALLAVRAQHKHTAVGLVAEELQGSFTASFKGFDVGVLAAEGVSVKLCEGEVERRSRGQGVRQKKVRVGVNAAKHQ
jgi:hypothetical protein